MIPLDYITAWRVHAPWPQLSQVELYQRKKGRDLFDLWYAAQSLEVSPKSIVSCFLHYLEHEEHQVSRAEFELNLFGKLNDKRFIDDIGPLLTTGTSWNYRSAATYVLQVLAPLMPGDTWGKTKTQGALL